MNVNRLAFLVMACGWTACLLAIALTLASPELAQSPSVQWSPWLIGLFLVGIPHGALDHRVGTDLAGVGNRASPSTSGLGFYTAYLAAAVFVLLIWLVWPIAALLGFLAFAAFHFGEGDVYWSHRFGLAARSGSLGYRIVLLISRSLLPIALPLLSVPVEMKAPVELFSGRILGQTHLSIPPGALNIVLAGLAAIVALQIVWACCLARSEDAATRRSAALDIGETLLLVATFAIVPPVLAIGIYFNTWHSLRHMARLLLTSPSTAGLAQTGQWGKALVQLYRDVIPMTLGAVVLIAVVPFVLEHFDVSIAGLGLIALVGLSMLTLPHVLVVLSLNVKQGVWSSLPHRGS